MATKTYTVHRGMHGDGRDYEIGDTRELDETDAAALVETGALALVGEEPKTRAPAVKHTYGKAKPTGHLVTSIATSDAEMLPVTPGATPVAAEVVTAPKGSAKA